MSFKLAIQVSLIQCFICVFFNSIGQTRYVDVNTGIDQFNCGTTGFPCKTIQYTLDKIANSNEVIYLRSGVYSLPSGSSSSLAVVELPPNKSFHFVGDTLGTGAIIDGKSLHRGFRYNHKGFCPPGNALYNGLAELRNFSFENLTIKNCYYSSISCGSTFYANGGGIHIKSDPLDSLFISIINCSFSENLLEDLTTYNNHARSTSGAGIFIEGEKTTYTNVDIQSCSFNNNRAVQMDNGGNGGAISLQRISKARITNSSFCSNVVEGLNANNGDLQNHRNSGSAIHFFDDNNSTPAHDYLIDRCSFIDNLATTPHGSTFNFQSVGAVFLSNTNSSIPSNATLRISNSQFYNNRNEVSISHIDKNTGTIDTSSIGNNIFGERLESLLGPDTVICKGSSITIGQNLPFGYYLWSNGSTDPIIDVLGISTDSLWVEVDIAGCIYRDTIVVYVDSFSLDLGPDLSLCSPFSYTLSPGSGYASYLWQDGSTNSDLTVHQADTYFVTVEYSRGCFSSDTVIITEAITVDLGSDTSLCAPYNYLISPGGGFTSYQWQDGSTDTSFTVIEPGLYSVTVTNDIGCVGVDSIQISNSISLNLGEDTTFCTLFSYTMSPQGNYSSYLWQDGSTDSSFTAATHGVYSVVVTNSNGCSATDTLTISTIAALLDLGNDTNFCSSFNYIIDPGPAFATYQWQDGSNSQTFFVDSPGQYSVSITTDSGCFASDTILISLDTFSIDLGEDRTFCSDFVYELNPGPGYDFYLWQDGSNNQKFTATESGDYSVLVVNENGCVAKDTIHIFAGAFSIDLGQDTSFCSKSNYLLTPGEGYSSYKWQDSSSKSVFEVESSGVYSVSVTNNLGCTASDTVSISAKIYPLDLGNDTALCVNSALILNAGVTGARYLWQNGSTDSIHVANKTGLYYVKVEIDDCLLTDSIDVFIHESDSFTLVRDTLCEGESLSLDAAKAKSSYLWQDGTTSSTYVATEGGIFEVQIKNVCGVSLKRFVIKSDDCRCTVFIPNTFSPNSDGNNDLFMPVFYCDFQEYHFLVFNRWGEKVYETNNPYEGWDGTFKGERAEVGKYFYKLSYKSDRAVLRKYKEGRVSIIR